MEDKQLLTHARAVASLAAKLPTPWVMEAGERYCHMGALLSDAILQAGMNYRTVVVPRVNSVLERFPSAGTTPAFKDLLVDAGAAAVLQWSHPEKPRRLFELTMFLVDNCIFTTTAFRTWLLVDSNPLLLRSLRGIGPKTVDYLKCLCGIDAVAVDRHIQDFVAKAGVPRGDYTSVQRVVERAADLLGVSRSQLDRMIWASESAVS